jgi:hypothetical protein
MSSRAGTDDSWQQSGVRTATRGPRCGLPAMSAPESSPEATPPGAPDGQEARSRDNEGWTIFSYLIAGMIAYGLIGWLVGYITHIAILLPLGALAGLVIAIAGVIFRYGRA